MQTHELSEVTKHLSQANTILIRNFAELSGEIATLKKQVAHLLTGEGPLQRGLDSGPAESDSVEEQPTEEESPTEEKEVPKESEADPKELKAEALDALKQVALTSTDSAKAILSALGAKNFRELDPNHYGKVVSACDDYLEVATGSGLDDLPF